MDDVVDHELSAVETTAGYVRRTINPVLGELPLRKLQYRVDLLSTGCTCIREAEHGSR